MVEMILDYRPMPTARERQIDWLVVNFALLFNLPAENISVVHNDDMESVTVHLACTNACRCVMTFTLWCDSDDNVYSFFGPSNLVLFLALEPSMGEI